MTAVDDLTQLLSPTVEVDADQAAAVVGIVTAMARAYTRGGGFIAGEPNEEIGAVILTASARLLAHPRQVQMSQVVGPMSATHGRGFDGWTVAEVFVLNRYRVTAM